MTYLLKHIKRLSLAFFCMVLVACIPEAENKVGENKVSKPAKNEIAAANAALAPKREIGKTVATVATTADKSKQTLAENSSVLESSKKPPHNMKFPGKPHAPIELKFILPKGIAVGETMSLDLTVEAGRDADDLLVTLRADDGLLLLNNQQQFAFGQQRTGQQSEIKVTVMPEKEGLYYIYLSARLVLGADQQSRSFVIPVKVGNVDIRKSLKPAGVLQQEEGEAGIVSMPAVETTE